MAGRTGGPGEGGADLTAAEVEGLGAELPELLRALRDGHPFVRLIDGSMGLVLPEWLAHHRRLATLGKLTDGALRVPRAAASLLDAMLATLPAVELDAAFRKLRVCSPLRLRWRRAVSLAASAASCGHTSARA